ncbi:Protein of unknown function [Flavobacteriaceae bacterium MAR_2010_188]|nr:Protein of unknown function [Flavobacteriaceae bacterium MAR_2010_188]
MKKVVLKFGMLGFITAFGLFCLALLLGEGLSYNAQQLLGYGTMVASLSFVYIGIKHYRDNENSGSISFGKGLKVGVLISMFASFGIALFDVIYTTLINPDFVTEYLNTGLAQLETEYSGTELASKKAELIQQMEDYSHPLFMAAMMFLTTLIIGFIISLISAFILKKKRK